MWLHFKRFMTTVLWRPAKFPISRYELSLFLTTLQSQSYKFSTIQSYASAISFIHKINELPDPTKSFYIQRLLKGAKKLLAARTSLKPIRHYLLCKMIDKIVMALENPYTNKMMKALLLLSYYACLRAGEVLKTNTADHILIIDNVHIEMGQDKLHLKIKLPTYKHSNGPAVLIIPSCTQTSYCPVNSVLNYLLLRNHTTGPLFLNQDNSLLKRRHLADLIKNLVKLLNLQPRSYNTHSPRIGRTTDLASKGVPDQMIRQIGRWRSDAYLKYIKLDFVALPV